MYAEYGKDNMAAHSHDTSWFHKSEIDVCMITLYLSAP